MERLDKVERLRERANISYEEAKAVLDQAGDDLLEALLILERQGKVKSPEQGAYSTRYQENAGAEPQTRAGKKEKKRRAQSGERSGIGKVFHRIFDFIRGTSFCISREEKTLFTMPTWLMAILFIAAWHVALPASIIALFFGIRYSFSGHEDADSVNDVLDKAESFADGVRSELGRDRSTGTQERGAHSPSGEAQTPQETAQETPAAAQAPEAPAAEDIIRTTPASEEAAAPAGEETAAPAAPAAGNGAAAGAAAGSGAAAAAPEE